MFGMSFGEILVIAIIAILFIGPDKLPDTMVKVAKFFRSFKKSIHEVKDSIEQEVHLAELKEEAISYKEQLEKSVDEIKNSTNINVMDDLTDGFDDIKDSFTKLDETPEKLPETEPVTEITEKPAKKSTKKKGKKKDV
ncbi:MAG: Sec-independent protein translocase TatB [Sulfurospirillum sp.]|nr:MAG: Sec-independent protein translocase TatB [Sulfurospirillum sp.]